MSSKKDKKQFPLDSIENCRIYLFRIISSCELCMVKFEKYNAETAAYVEKYSGSETIPYDIYGDLCDKTYNVISYLSNLLGDAQKTSISYFKYRTEIEKRIKRGITDIPLFEISDDLKANLLELNKYRNWINHVPESLLISELELVQEGKLKFDMDPVTIHLYKAVTYDYFLDLYHTNQIFCKNIAKILSAAKADYALLMGKSVDYPKVYTEIPFGIEKSEATKISAKIQGL